MGAEPDPPIYQKDLPDLCPYCGCEDGQVEEVMALRTSRAMYCNNCGRTFSLMKEEEPHAGEK